MTQHTSQPIEFPAEFVVLTGFLGSGKTTLLIDFLAQPEAADTAVIINEAGQINIDGAIIAQTGHALPVALLSNGCVCCSVANDLLYTIEALLQGRLESGQPPFRRIVLECSGLARPSSVLRSLGPLSPLRMPTRIVATIDANASSLDAGFEDAVAQLAAAQTIVVMKLDQQTKPDSSDASTRVKGINPLAHLVETQNPRDRALGAFLTPGTISERMGNSRLLCENRPLAHPRIMATLATFSPPPAWLDLEEWLENLAGFCGARLLRVKGIVPVAGSPEPFLIQSVGTLFSMPCRMTRSTGSVEGLVVITRDLPLTSLQEADLGNRATFT